jgi:thioredoxin 1
MAVLNVTTHNFEEEVLQTSKKVLIDFWAPWCGPCRMVAPVVDEVAKEVPPTTKVVKVNIDEQPELAAKFGVMSIPTLVVMENGKVTAASVGVKNKPAILSMLKL